MGATAGLILCGGRSSRMGYDKMHLRFPSGPLWQRVVERMQQVASPLVLSLSMDSEPPEGLPKNVEIVRDSAPERGPLWGLAEGFRALASRSEQVLVMPVDMPFMEPIWLERLVAGLKDHRACLYQWEGFRNALTAAYRLDLLPKLEGLIAAERARPFFLIEDEPTLVLEVEDLWQAGAVPPPLMDVDRPEDYRQALLLEGVGEAGAVPITLLEKGNGNSSCPPISIFANQKEHILQALTRLFPHVSTFQLVTYSGEPVSPDARFQPGEKIYWQQDVG